MSKKNTIFSLMFLLVIVSVNFLSISPLKTNNLVKSGKNSGEIEFLMDPKSSGYAVTSKWNVSTVEWADFVTVSADGEYMVIGTGTGTGKELILKKTSTNETIWTYDIGCNIYNVAISSDGSRIVAGFDSMETYELFLFNNSISAGNKEPMWEFDTGNDCYWVDISANGEYIVAGTENQGLYLFNDSIPAGAKQPIWNKGDIPSSGPEHVAISANGEYIVAGYTGDIAGLGVWFFNNSYHSGTNKLPEWNYTTIADVNSIAISEKGEYIAAGCLDGGGAEPEYYLFNKSSEGVKLPQCSYNTGGTVNSVAISANGSKIAVGCSSGAVATHYYFNNTPSVNKLPEWTYDTTYSVMSVDITADGKYIVSGIDAGAPSPDHSTLFFNNSGEGIKTPEWSMYTGKRTNSVSISSWGNYIGAGGTWSVGGLAYVIYHARPIPSTPSDTPADNPDNEEPPGISYGYYYLFFAGLTIISLIIIYKRKQL